VTDFQNIPDSLRAIPQWVLWKYEERNGKRTKVPYQATGAHAKSTDPSTWASFDQVAAVPGFAGIGFVVTTASGIVGVDLDHVVEDGVLSPFARTVVERLDSYAEISPSGTGIRIFCHGALPLRGRKKGHVEMYSTGRFLTVTGNKLPDARATVEQRSAELASFHLETFGPQEPERPAPGAPRTPVPLEDEELLAKMRSSENGDRWARLYDDGDWKGAGYPSPSDADLALCSTLAFWTDHDTARMDRLFRASRLIRRKWDELRGPTTYGERTLERALKGSGNAYRPGEKFTDTGNARRLVRLHGGDLRYCGPLGWLVFDGKRWVRDETEQCSKLAQDVPRELFAQEAKLLTRAASGKNPAKNRERAKLIRKHAEKSESEPSIRRMIALARPDLAVRVDTLDRDPWLLAVENGTLDLKTGTLLPHRREDLITKLAPVAFDPTATAPTWDRFLATVTGGDRDLSGYLQRIAGMCLTGDASDQVFFLFHGTGANGKSTFISVLAALLGDYAIGAQFSSFMAARNGNQHGPRGDIARMRGARMVSAIEHEDGGALSMGLMKQLSGGDAVTCAFKFRDEFSFVPSFKIVLAANDKPSIRSNDHATWRRLKLVPWATTIPENQKDKGLKDKLVAEAPGILAWAVRGCLDWQRDGLREPAAVTRATGEYRADEDDFGAFVQDRCERTPGARAAARELFDAYVTFTKGRGGEPVSEKKFAAKLAGLALTKKLTKAGKQWEGIALRDAPTCLAKVTGRVTGDGW
jgi:putative DNA primase/helicase